MNIAVCGLGKAGKVLAKSIIDDNNNNLSLAICRNESLTSGKDVGTILGTINLDIPIVPLDEAVKELRARNIDVVIDFSNKDTSLKLLDICDKASVNLVICTTNMSDDEERVIKAIAQKANIGVVEAPNLTIGINLLMDFVETLSIILPDFDFEIVEKHRRDKPRITTTAKIIAKKIHRDEVHISSVRAGGYVGIHEVIAASENERITIEHESFNRMAFSNGALLAAKFVFNRKGYYTMSDVIKDLKASIDNNN